MHAVRYPLRPARSLDVAGRLAAALGDMGGFLAFRLRRLVWDARQRLRPATARQVDTSDREALFASAGFVLTPPTERQRGIYLVNGTRLPEFEAIADEVRGRYVTVLTHWWELSPQRVREYRRLAALFDCVVSPSERLDRTLGFAPIYRSNSLDLFVDDTIWPLLDRPRNIDFVESVSVPWVHKRPLAWLRDVRGYFDREGGGKAVYMTKREPNEKEDERCHRAWWQFLGEAEGDNRISVSVGGSQAEVLETYNRARFLYHPSSSDFGPRCIWEALYTGAMVILQPFPWVKSATARPELWQRIVLRKRLSDLPEHTVVDVRQWQTAHGVRRGLVDMLVERHDVNREFERFTMFSSSRVVGGG
jgi:hypothetical protein